MQIQSATRTRSRRVIRRALLALTAAAADAAAVPSGFVYNATYSSANDRRRNRLFFDSQTNLYLSVDPRYRNLTVGSVANAGRNGHDGITSLWLQQKYTSDAAPIPIASWWEARLITAEIAGGQAAVSAINELRAASGLPAYFSIDPVAIKARVYEERRRELFLQGNRINDMLRLSLPFDTGATFKGVPYGATTCLPLPDSERFSNPNFKP